MIFEVKKIVPIFCIFVFISLISPAYAYEENNNLSNSSTQGISQEEIFRQLVSTANTTVTVFYSSSCSSCHRVLPVIENLSENYQDIEVRYYDLYNSTENLTLFYEFGAYYNMHYVSYPVLFTGDSVVLSGISPIMENAEDVFHSLDKGLIPDRDYEKRWMTEDKYSGTADLNQGIWAGVLLVAAAGLVDGINPCAFAVLVFLIISLAASNSRKKVLASGLLYTSAVFIFYVMAGFGIMNLVEFTGYSYFFSLFAGIVAITAGLINIIDALSKNSHTSLSIPDFSKGTINEFIKKATLPSAFILGLIVGMFELPCTGGIYLAIISLLSSEMTFYEGIPYLILYNVFFVVPLLLITAVTALGLSPDFVNSVRVEHKNRLRLIIGIILIVTGIFVIWWQL